MTNTIESQPKKLRTTLGLLQGWLDIGAMVILSLLCFIWAGQTSLGFCLLTCTFISLISSGSGRTSNEFQPCSKPCSLCAILHIPATRIKFFGERKKVPKFIKMLLARPSLKLVVLKPRAQFWLKYSVH